MHTTRKVLQTFMFSPSEFASILPMDRRDPEVLTADCRSKVLNGKSWSGWSRLLLKWIRSAPLIWRTGDNSGVSFVVDVSLLVIGYDWWVWRVLHLDSLSIAKS